MCVVFVPGVGAEHQFCLWLEGDASGAVDECCVVEAAEVVAEFVFSGVLECVEELVDVCVAEWFEFHGGRIYGCCNLESF